MSRDAVRLRTIEDDRDAPKPPRGGAAEPAAADDPDRLLAELRARLDDRRRAEDDPFANPLLLLSLDVKRRLDDGEWGYAGVERLVRRLTADAFLARARRLGRYMGEVDVAANTARVRGLIERLTRDGEDVVPFEAFRERVERAGFGIVFTAHPTFGLDPELMRLLAELAVGVDADGRPLDAEATDRVAERACRLDHRPPAGLDLALEHALSSEAIGHLHNAVGRLCGVVLEVARERYPERWLELSPRLVTVASWVGFDLDGRSDIGWARIFATALQNRLMQFERFRRICAELRRGVAGRALGHVLDLLDARLALAERETGDALAVFDAGAEDLHSLKRQARALHTGRAGRLVTAEPLVSLIDSAIELDAEGELTPDLAALRAAIRGQGLSLAHVHARINAAQLHNAVRKRVGMATAPDDPSRKWTYLETIGRLIDEAEPVAINFGSIVDEETSAKRVFMLIAQMLKYVDADQPIRFLIAESETPLTLLAALYFAKLFGIDDRLDISPLFETGKALAHGHTIVDEALACEGFRAYVLRRGRLCIQTGYSDAGRHLGQTAAAAAIERLKLRVADVLARRGLTGVELVVFDTHGESIGRGGHPGGFPDRLRYVDPPEARRRFRAAGLAVKQEVSFQGGDGYLPFMTDAAAFASLCRIIEHTLETPDEGGDPFYAEQAYVEEFFTQVAQFNAGLMNDPDFGTLLGAYGPNMLYPSGSRSLKRQHDQPGGRPDVDHPAQLRAIPQNAILQQLGCLANTIGGVGHAVGADPERFQRLYRDSPRFRRLMNMVEHAFMYTDMNVLKAYVDLFDPGLWLLRAARRGDGHRAEEMVVVARIMEEEGLHERLVRAYRRLLRDHRALAGALREHRRRTRDEGERPIAVGAEERDTMHMLHALRIGLIQKLFLLATHLPEFSGRHGVTREDLIRRLVHLDVPSVLGRLHDIFPVQEARVADGDFGERATYRSDASQGYAEEHATLFRPMDTIYGLIRRIGGGVVHNIGALG